MKINVPLVTNNYSINSEGFIRNDKFNRILTRWKNNRGYEAVQLSCIDGITRSFTIHRLMAHHFIPGFDISDRSIVVHHKDSVNKTNSLDLLTVCTQKENIKYSIEEGNKPNGEKHPMGKFPDELANKIVALLQKEKSTDEIFNILDLEVKKNMRIFINDLRAKRTRLYLTEGLDLKKYVQEKHDINLVKRVIRYMKIGMTVDNIINMIGKGNAGRHERERYSSLIQRIHDGKAWGRLYKDDSSTTNDDYMVIKIKM